LVNVNDEILYFVLLGNIFSRN